MLARPAQADKPQPISPRCRRSRRLRGIAPTQSHVMPTSINGGSGSPAADGTGPRPYYFNGARNRMNWAIRINPAVKAARAGRGSEGSSTASTPARWRRFGARSGRGQRRFGGAYRVMLESCYSCHSGRPPVSAPMVPLSRPHRPSISSRTRSGQNGGRAGHVALIGTLIDDAVGRIASRSGLECALMTGYRAMGYFASPGSSPCR